MADLMGSLGLDTAAIERALDNVSKKLTNTAINAEGLNLAITASGAAIAIWAKNFVDASQKADMLDKAIKNVAKALSSSEFTSESALETRLKE